jgi:hypothetical protein
MAENQIYVLTRSTIFRFVRYMLFVQLFCKTKVIANLQLEAGRMVLKFCAYDAVHIALSIVLPSNQLYTNLRVYHKLQNIILHHLLKFH